MSASTLDGPNLSVDGTEFRRMVSCFPTGVAVMTTVRKDGGYAAAVTQSFAMGSFDPPLVLWSIRLWSPNFPTFRDASRFAVNILSREQEAIARGFFETGDSAVGELPLKIGGDGLPLLEGCAAQLGCRREATNWVGNNVAIIGRVERFTHFEGRNALILYQGDFVHMDTASKPGRS